MKIKNKKTGEVITVCPIYLQSQGEYNSLAELSEEWEDYEEPKDNNYWYIDDFGRIQFSSEVLDEIEEHPNNWMAQKLFGNYFETREEAEKAVKKLKAWKRLKDGGFKFKDFARLNDQAYIIRATSNESWTNLYDDLELLFGGEE